MSEKYNVRNVVIYEGGYNSCGLYHGRGTLWLPTSNVKFEGHFLNGEKHGRGCLYFEDGEHLSGVWFNGALNGRGTYTFSDQSKLVGHWIDGVCTGEVEEFDRSGKLTWKGSYLDGVRHGFGIQYFPEGSRIEGTWKNGILDGNGVFYFYPDNSYLHGIWKVTHSECNFFECCYIFQSKCPF
jgi:histone-lysine N-methyltransferase SETD7